MGIDQPFLHVEDFYGEWHLDSVMRTGRGLMDTGEELVERFSDPVFIGKNTYFSGNYLIEDLCWCIDTIPVLSDSYFFTLVCQNIISDKNPARMLIASKFGSHKERSFDISMPGFIATYYDGWFLFYKKVKMERLTDYANPYLQHLLGSWEPYEFQYFNEYFITSERFQSIYSNPIEFNSFQFTDHTGEVHDVAYEINTLPTDASPTSLWLFPDSARASLGTIAEFTIFSNEGYILNRFELSESGVLGDMTTSGSILYRKQPPPPLKKQGAQP